MTDDRYHLWPEFERERLCRLDELVHKGPDETPGAEAIEQALGVLGWLRLSAGPMTLNSTTIDKVRLLLDDRYDP